jgi:hypothetical protein
VEVASGESAPNDRTRVALSDTELEVSERYRSPTNGSRYFRISLRMLDILIQNGVVVDGRGREAFRADVGITAGRNAGRLGSRRPCGLMLDHLPFENHQGHLLHHPDIG